MAKKIKISREDKAFGRMVDKLKKQFKGGLSTLSDNLKESGRTKVERIPTGCLALDRAIGGGWAKGRIIEIAGGESTGKTTLTYATIAKAQRSKLTCAFIDAENATDPVYIKNLGVDFKTLLFSQPETGEETLQQVIALVEAEVDLIVVDSVAALTPKKEFEEEMEKENMGLQSRMMGKAMRKLSSRVSKANCCLIFINQLRAKMGVRFGDKEDSPGGKALKFYASQRIRLANLGDVKSGSAKVAKKIKAIVKKSKVGIPGRTAEYQIVFGKGIDKDLDLWDTLRNLDLCHKKTKDGKARFYCADQKYKDFEDFQEQIHSEKGLRKMLVKMVRANKDDGLQMLLDEDAAAS